MDAAMNDKQCMNERGKGMIMVSLFFCLWSHPVSAQTTIRMGAGGAQTATIPFTTADQYQTLSSVAARTTYMSNPK